MYAYPIQSIHIEWDWNLRDPRLLWNKIDINVPETFLSRMKRWLATYIWGHSDFMDGLASIGIYVWRYIFFWYDHHRSHCYITWPTVVGQPMSVFPWIIALQLRHNKRDGASNYRPKDCLLHRLFRRRSKKMSKLPVTGLCGGNSPVTNPHKWPVTRIRFPFDDVIIVRMADISVNIMKSWHRDAFGITDLCEGNPSVHARFPSQMVSDAEVWWFFDVSHKLLNKQLSCWWFETPWH